MITDVLLTLWASLALTIYLIEFVRWHRLWPVFDRKPFNCEVCLPVWLFAVLLPTAIYPCPYPLYIAAAATAGIVTPLLIKLIRS